MADCQICPRKNVPSDYWQGSHFILTFFTKFTEMTALSADWLTRGLIDFEYKKYVLLAYLKSVKENFGRVELYPYLADLVFHYRNLLDIRDNRTVFRESFPRELSLEEFKHWELRYRELVQDDTIMTELASIIEFAIPQVKDSLDEGSVIYEYVEANCQLSSVGVTPLYAKEGYLFVTQPPERETSVYRYQLSIFGGSQEQFRSLNTEYLETVAKSPVEPYESIKTRLIRKFRALPNPATYLIVSRMRFPETETLLPVAKRLFVKHLSSSGI
jgi:hypothetical protein